MKHTKGPWKVDEKTEYTISVHAPWSDRVKVVEEQTFGDYRGALICEMHYNSGVPTKEKALANAKLIAAAPDMLEVCKSILADDEQDGVLLPTDRVNLKNAINKATE